MRFIDGQPISRYSIGSKQTWARLQITAFREYADATGIAKPFSPSAEPRLMPCDAFATIQAIHSNAMDLFPTLLGIFESQLPSNRVFDGESMVPLPRRRIESLAFDESFLCYICETLQTVRLVDWKRHLPRTSDQLRFWDKNKASPSQSKPSSIT